MRGGVALYVREGHIVELMAASSNGTVEYLLAYDKTINLVVGVIYRPPTTVSKQFNVIVDELKRLFLAVEDPQASLVLCGDINFPGTVFCS